LLKPIGFIFDLYIEKHFSTVQHDLKDDWIRQSNQLKQVEKVQKSLEAKAKALEKTQKAIAAKAKADKEKARRVNNERFARWLDNAAWSVRVFCTNSKVLLWIVAVHWFLLFPVVVGLSVRGVLSSDRCFKSETCRVVVRWVIR
jgi:hypothetical protein